MDKDKLLKEAVDFFRQEQGLKRLLQGFIKNYRSLGRVGGTVKLKNITPQEKEALSGLLGKDYSRQVSATISVKKFADSLSKTKFYCVDLQELLLAYGGGKVLTKNEEKRRYNKERETFFRRIIEKQLHPISREWLQHINAKGNGTRGINIMYDRDPDLLENQLNKVLEALVVALKQKEAGTFRRLPVFAGKVANDPHAFDLGTEQGRILITALEFARQLGDKNLQYGELQGAEEMTELLAYYGILRDDLHNYVTCTGIVPSKKEQEQGIYWWREACEEWTTFNLPLREIVKYESFSIYSEKKNVVFAVENSGVFSEIIDHFEAEGFCSLPLVCTNGQFKLATLYLFDRLVKNKTQVYYSGDFDPEGLQMAQRLSERYPEQVRLWRYKVADYEACHPQVTIPQHRLRKLDKIKIPALLATKDMLQSRCKVGYQEHILRELIEDIKEIYYEK